MPYGMQDNFVYAAKHVCLITNYTLFLLFGGLMIFKLQISR